MIGCRSNTTPISIIKKQPTSILEILFKHSKFNNYILKNQLLQFPMHNFSLKTYHLKCLKSVSKTIVNISLMKIKLTF